MRTAQRCWSEVKTMKNNNNYITLEEVSNENPGAIIAWAVSELQ